MHIPHLLQQRFAEALQGLTENVGQYAAMIRATADPRHGDYQANCAMPLSKQIGENPRQVAAQLVERLRVDDLCEPPQIAGPGFINLTLQDSFLIEAIQKMLGDPRCSVASVGDDNTIVIDFSSPNVAKPMHVGHIRSTVIGDTLARTLRFLGHRVITDNHLGDWGTQFGMIIYGYKHFGDPAVVDKDPVAELTKLYRLVNQLIGYRKALAAVDSIEASLAEADQAVAEAIADADHADAKSQKKADKAVKAAQRRQAGLREELASTRAKILEVEQDPDLSKQAAAHPKIEKAVLQETAKLHQGDAENLALWEKFLPHCKDEINRIYARLDVSFDHTLGESFYHSMLADIVAQLEAAGLAKDSDGAVCVFLDEFDAPMIVRKQDGAFLYATTDLATLKYRLQEFDPAEILYVVDTRQSEHFNKLFAVADHFGLERVKLAHVNFGAVLDKSGRPIKTRSGDLIGLESLLNDAVERARQVVCDPARLSVFDPPMDEGEQAAIAEAVGIGAIKFADLSHHRTSDYRYDLDKMISLDGNTSAYVQYSYARSQSILAKAGKTESDVVELAARRELEFTEPAERGLALMLIKLEEALLAVHNDYAPNQLVDYLLDTAKSYSKFNDTCHVLRAETDAIRATRLALVAQTGALLRLGLGLLGIHVVPRM